MKRSGKQTKKESEPKIQCSPTCEHLYIPPKEVERKKPSKFNKLLRDHLHQDNTKKLERRPSKERCLVRQPSKVTNLVRQPSKRRNRMYSSGRLRRSTLTVDLTNWREVLLNFRAIVDMAYLLAIDADEERKNFYHALVEAGWSEENIHDIEERAYYKTIYERELPHVKRPAGSMEEWNRNKHRWEK